MNPHTLEELWNNICYNVSVISGEELRRVNSTEFHRYSEYIWLGGQYFQHLLLHWWVFVRLSKGYNHCDILSSSYHCLLLLLRCGMWSTDIWVFGHACFSRGKRSTLNKFTGKWLWHMFRFEGKLLSALGVLCLLIINKTHFYHPVYIYF
jgi:hypothetical protein